MKLRLPRFPIPKLPSPPPPHAILTAFLSLLLGHSVRHNTLPALGAVCALFLPLFLLGLLNKAGPGPTGGARRGSLKRGFGIRRKLRGSETGARCSIQAEMADSLNTNVLNT